MRRTPVASGHRTRATSRSSARLASPTSSCLRFSSVLLHPGFGSVTLALLGFGQLLQGLHAFEQTIEAIEALLPVLAVPLEPLVGLGERLGFEATGPALRVATARDESRTLQHLEVLRDGR